MKYRCWFDGGCGPINPGGYATCGAIVYAEGKQVWISSECIGSGPQFSNNVAEYGGLLAILDYLKRTVSNGDEIRIYGDSAMVVRQMNGTMKANRGLYLPWYVRARNALDMLRFTCRISLEWIPREQNEEADQLCRDAMPFEAYH